VEHFDREVGTSGYTLKSLIKLWSNIIGFSVMPLRIASGIGVIFATIGITGTLIILIKKLLFHSTAVGWTSIMMAICFFSGIILLFMGLIGEYIGRMFLASNNQPQYVVREVFKQCEED
jgi:undecaprenyl-phosphate 4-deoxy-4-formamido-L-arabinose transferase